MSLPNQNQPVGVIGIDPGDGSGTGSYPPVMATPVSPTPPPTPPSTPTPPPPPVTLPAASSRTSSLAPASVKTVAALIIPLAAAPSQEFAVPLGNQSCRIALYTRGDSLYLDLLLADQPIVQGVVCLDRQPMVLAAYNGFVGELLFFDTQATDDPTWSGLGARFLLVWLGV